MSLVAIYELRCPSGHTIELPETILEGIIQHLRESYTDEPGLNFVCSECKTAFHYDYQNRVRAGRDRRTASSLRVPRIERSKRMRW